MVLTRPLKEQADNEEVLAPMLFLGDKEGVRRA